jgi:hypothetical protein
VCSSDLEITSPSVKTGVPLTKETTEPLSRTNDGEPELSSNIELENTFDRSEPGEFIPKTFLLTNEESPYSIKSICSEVSMKLRIGTHKKSKEIVIARYFRVDRIPDIQA